MSEEQGVGLSGRSAISLCVRLVRVVGRRVRGKACLRKRRVPARKRLSGVCGVDEVAVEETVRRLYRRKCLGGVRKGKAFMRTPGVCEGLRRSGGVDFARTYGLGKYASDSRIVSFQVRGGGKRGARFLRVKRRDFICRVREVLSTSKLPMVFRSVCVRTSHFPSFPVSRLRGKSLAELLRRECRVYQRGGKQDVVRIKVMPRCVTRCLRMSRGRPIVLLGGCVCSKSNEPLCLDDRIVIKAECRVSI